ncbi:MAG: dioxygenase [Campylobacteraceae bacterium]|nr:dioxygenase [Campylobacteraceae bacterium]
MKSIFHLAYNVLDLNIAREFYLNILECKEGRSSKSWIDIEFFGHQLSLHLGKPFETLRTGRVGDQMVPMPHLGVILEYDDWKKLSEKLKEENINFIIEPSIRFSGLPGEQYTMFFYDPFGNPIEMKAFKDLNKVFEY